MTVIYRILPIAFALFLISCSPYQRLILVPANRDALLTDTCDIRIIGQLKQTIDKAGYTTLLESNELPEVIEPDSCDYFARKLFSPPARDSSIWFLTIRPEYVGKKEIILGNLYTLYPAKDDSVIVFVRRIKEYSQKEEFENGKYLGFTYFLENDTTVIIKLGTRVF